MYTFPDADSAGRCRRRLATTRHDPILITTSSWMPIPVCSPMATESTSPALDASGSSSRRQAPLKNITQPDAPALHCCHSKTICWHDPSAPPVSVHAQVPADEIILNFDSLSLEEGYDFLRVSHVNSSRRCSAVRVRVTAVQCAPMPLPRSCRFTKALPLLASWCTSSAAPKPCATRN